MTILRTWVIGRGGLLGSHLDQAFSSHPQIHVWRPRGQRFQWQDALRLKHQFRDSCRAFSSCLRDNPQEKWAILWAGGQAVVGTSASAIQGETDNLKLFVGEWDNSLHANLDCRPGLFFLAGSAGGVYGASPHQPITESSPSCPISDYGENKLVQEKVLSEWAANQKAVSYLIGRITNLYGFPVAGGNAKGLIAHLARNLVLNKPLHLYVSLDTIRDFIEVGDCASYVLRSMLHLAALQEEHSEERGHLKIFGSERAVSLAQIIRTFARVAKKQPRLILGPSPLRNLQPQRLQFRSDLWPHTKTDLTSLNIGIFRVYQQQMAMFQSGRL